MVGSACGGKTLFSRLWIDQDLKAEMGRERAVMVRHAVKNALIPVVTLIGLQLPIVVGRDLLSRIIFGTRVPCWSGWRQPR